MTTNPQLARIANYVFGGTADVLVSPATLYFGLCTGTVSTSGAITGEVAGGGYARVAVPNNKTQFSTATVNGSVTNLQNISFPASTASWGAITTIFVSDVATGGTALYYVTLTTPRSVQSGVTVYFQGDPTGSSGDISLSVTN